MIARCAEAHRQLDAATPSPEPDPGAEGTPRGTRSAAPVGEVVDRLTADRLGREVRLHPGGDRRGRGAAPGPGAADRGGDVVVDLAFGHVALKRGEAEVASLVVEPPMAMTASSLASSRLAALCDPNVAATQR